MALSHPPSFIFLVAKKIFSSRKKAILQTNTYSGKGGRGVEKLTTLDN